VAFAFVVLPPWAVALTVVFSALALVARYDNQLGTFLPLALIFTIIIAVLLVLLGGMAMLRI
jgi:hypothetical protein